MKGQGPRPTGAGWVQKLQSYVHHLPYDSFSASSHCSNEKLFEVKRDHKGTAVVSLNVFVGFPKAIKDEAHQFVEHGVSNIDEAKERIAERVCAKLAKCDEPVDLPRKVPKVQDPGVSKINRKLAREHLLPPLRERWKLQWPHEVDVSLFIVEAEDDEGCSWGLLTTSPAHHNYQLTIGKHQLRLEVDKVDWNPEDLDNVLRFHSAVVAGKELPELLVVKVQDGKVDFEAMKESPSNPPQWLPGLHRRMDGLCFWELARQSGPAEPAPSPLKLEKIFDEPEQGQRQEFKEDLECMARVGKETLRLAAAVAESSRDPSQTRESLKRKVEEYLDDSDPQRLAHLLDKTGLIQLGTRDWSTFGTKEVCEMAYALMGAHKLESDVFSVLRLWEWFIALANEDLDDEDKYKGLEETASDYVAACPRYLGRTLSYIEFGEMEPPEKDKDVPGPYLQVRFEDSDDGWYRWNKGIAEEKRPEIKDEWRRLKFDALSGTFCSPSMKLQLVGSGGPDRYRDRPLPNKLCAWLRGRNVGKLVSIKHSVEQTLPYYYLREEEREEKDENGTCLIVYYKNLKGEVHYRRGGLGKEIFQGKKHLLSYSESKKTLVSQVFFGSALPRKVVTWILEGQCLADLIPGRRKGGGTEHTHQLVELEDGRKQASYFCKGETVTLQASPLKSPSAGGGFIYQYSTDSGNTWQALSYSEERKEWVRSVPGASHKSEEDAVPCEAIMAIAPSEEVSAGLAGSLRTPTTVRLLFPSASGTALAEIEQQTDHRFKRPQFLAEALTHYSAQSKAVRSNGHLALVGEIVMEGYVWEKAVREATFFSSHLYTGYKEGQPLPKSFSTPTGMPPPRAPKPETEENRAGQEGIENVISLQRRVWVCCNHVSYAFSSVMAELHENMNKDSQELQDAIARFARKLSRRDKDKDKEKPPPVKWPQLFKLGAPKAVGDVFLAVIGAITMDADYLEAESMILKHYQESEQIFSLMRERQAGIPDHSILSTNGLQELKHKYGNEYVDLFREALNSDHKPQTLALASIITEGANLREAPDTPDSPAFHVNDLCMVEVKRGSSSKKVIGSTPRNLLIHEGFEQDGGSSDGSEADEKSDSIPEDTQMADAAKNKPTEHDGAIYCKHCQMWLNGPTQWADHEIGKKHRKAVRRQQADKYSGKYDYDMPPSGPPDGFGKKAFQKGIEEDKEERDSTTVGSMASDQTSDDPSAAMYNWQLRQQSLVQRGQYQDPHTGEWVEALIIPQTDSSASTYLQ